MLNKEILNVIDKLSSNYCFDKNEALTLLGYNVEEDKNVEEEKLMLKGFRGEVYEDQCKAVVYDHGLYTQCSKKCSNEFCSSLCKKLKYGHINIRKEYPIGTYVLENGKREIKMSKLIKRLTKKEKSNSMVERINTEDSDEEGINEDQKISKRGRPKQEKKKIEYQEDEEDIEEILVKRVTIDGKLYYKSEDNNLYEM